jgi:hypothetical protein
MQSEVEQPGKGGGRSIVALDWSISSSPGNHDNTRLLVVLGVLSAAEDKGAKALSANYSTF